ncbi:hypothetical protein D7004_18485 [Pedobacter jejuensis]|uniref:Uncharacterized protein n=1 Tax=Pedobacter jejuensis TaxID=1268550 RepID=A0A3N0BNG2_9SPHI|nr:hypothetical protein D7004_18485 [Pedobacter jejuensis]
MIQPQPQTKDAGFRPIPTLTITPAELQSFKKILTQKKLCIAAKLFVFIDRCILNALWITKSKLTIR